ncbi:helix-turn-helix domain-containing protein [Cyanobium sp. Morenito 9A2]|uniref:helix-turn-helix domain-containing protein n=1 Tax=Cyanobium sp. Morenito 9A2 TaxID=2823718 RepID=UPI0020CC54D6|nr:RodZ domain-containing protein [Cyanobium sp. Morenito 9A2]
MRLGRVLREAREAKGLSLKALADQLHMGPGQLQALEDGVTERLPEKVFVIAQARRVATSLGLEADPLIEALRRIDFGTSAVSGATAGDRASALPRPPSATETLKSQPPASRTSAASARPEPTLTWALGGLGGLVLAASLGIHAWRQGQSTPNAPAPSAPPLTATQGAGGPGTAAPAAPSPGATSAVVLTSPEGSWIAVRSGSGPPLYEGLLKGERRFPADPDLKVLAGRPDLVTVRIGSAAPRLLGPINEVIWRPLR